MHRCTPSSLIWAVGTVWRSLCSKRMAQCIIDDFPGPDVWIGNLSRGYLGTGPHSGAGVHNYRIQSYNPLSQHEWRLAVGWPALLVSTGFHLGNRLLTQNAPLSCRHLQKHILATCAAAPLLQGPQQLLYYQFATRCHSYYKWSFKALTSSRQCLRPKRPFHRKLASCGRRSTCGSVRVMETHFAFAVVLDVATKPHRPASRVIWIMGSGILSEFVPAVEHIRRLIAVTALLFM